MRILLSQTLVAGLSVFATKLVMFLTVKVLDFVWYFKLFNQLNRAFDGRNENHAKVALFQNGFHQHKHEVRLSESRVKSAQQLIAPRATI